MVDNAVQDNLFYANGIKGATGGYGVPPLTEQALAESLIEADEPENTETLAERNRKSALMVEILKERRAELETALSKTSDPQERKQLETNIQYIERELKEREHFGTIEGVDPSNLAEAGWGIIFHSKDEHSAAIQEALSELLEHRQQQAGELFKIFAGPDGYREHESYIKFLGRFGVGPGPVDPTKGVPYYLLIIGSPAAIPYNFQYQLDVQYAVGRIDFDSLEDYARYARSVLLSETSESKLNPKASFFGVRNKGDKSTQMSQQHLVAPLHQTFANHAKLSKPWQFELVEKEQATKAALLDLLRGDENTPAVLFSASHGMDFNPTNGTPDPRQLPHQGALLCQNWPGPRRWRQEIPQDFYLAGDDLTTNTNLYGLMAFLFSCYGAGTPQYDEFDRQRSKGRAAPIAEKPFSAALPQRMLRQGALAVIGHVERAWGYSFYSEEAGREQLAVFESTMLRLFEGHPIGSAVEYFNERYAEMATILTHELEQVEFGQRPDDLPRIWTAHNDARNYVIIGDPAARIPVSAGAPSAMARPSIAVKGISQAGTTSSTPKTLAEPQKPAAISEEDWANTPMAVKELLQQYQTQYGAL